MCVVCVTVAGTVFVASQITPIEVLSDFSSTQRTLASFSGSSSSLSAAQKSQIKTLVNGSPNSETVVCTGFTQQGASKATVATAKNRSQAACDYAKRIKPSLKTTVLTRVTTARSNAGKVTVQVRTPKQETISLPEKPASTTTIPVENTPCTKVGEKVFVSNGYMKCFWQGGAYTEPISKQIFWRFFDTKKLQTSKSNNYATTPVENASCTGSGDTFDVAGGLLVCRYVHGKKLQWIRINNIKSSFTNPKSPVPLDVCRLQMSASNADRTGRNSGAGQVGFPMTNTTKNGMDPKGVNEVLIVPVDFPDFQGTGSPKQQLDYDVKWMLDWYNYFSNGQAKFNVTTMDKWFRMSKPRSGYETDGKSQDGLSAESNFIQGRQAQQFIDEITREIDLRKFSTVYIFYPDGEYTIEDLIVRNYKFKVKEGEKNLNFFSWGNNLEAGENLKWVFYIHETIHDFNIIGHAPGNGWPFGIMTNNTGISYAMNPWEQFLLDWLPENQIYCDDINTLKTTTISLSPMEREDKQTKMAVIKISPTKAVVIESHGIDKWSSFNTGDRSFPPGFYSVMAYVVDLDKAAAPQVKSDGDGLSNQYNAWAVWARVLGGKSTEYPYYPAAFGEDIYSATAVLGDSFEVEGVRIKFVGTGDYETIEISKIRP
jgi:hypothetical protein